MSQLNRKFLASLLQMAATWPFKIALYHGGADPERLLREGYTTQGEIEGTGYVAGGRQMPNPQVGMDARGPFLTFDPVGWSFVPQAPRHSLVYRADSNGPVVVLGVEDVRAGDPVLMSFEDLIRLEVMP